MYYQPYSLAESLELYLEDPHNRETVFSYENSAALDVREAFPDEICARLEKWGLSEYYVPTEFGGALESYDQLLMLIRLLARRDLTVAVGHGKTYLGSVCVWINGSQEQACKLGQLVCNGSIVSLALTESIHGSDLLANDFSAEPHQDGFSLNGEKWTINNATRGDLLSIFARTDKKGDSRGYSIFLVEKDKLPQQSYTCLDKLKTHGIRGADISGIKLKDAWVSSTAVVGKVGHGLETVLKALQVTRTLCAALSTGAVDNALRLTYKFATERQLYGKAVIELAHSRQVILDSFADLIISEVLSLISSRAIHVLTDQMSLISAVTKYLVPTTVDKTIERLSTVMGARAFLLDLFERGRFQKLERDHRIVGLFDGNTLVNLQVIINQLKSLAKYRQKTSVKTDSRISALFDLSKETPSFEREKLSISTRGRDAVLNSLYDAVRQIDTFCQTNSKSANLYCLKNYIKILLVELEKLDTEVLNTEWIVNSIPTKCFNLASKYSQLYAAAACIQFWLHNQNNMRGELTKAIWHDCVWLRVCLERLLSQLDVSVQPCADTEEVFIKELERQYHQNMLFSLLPLQLSDRATELGGIYASSNVY
jgi:alkylation response protein AidB-like acyl-CoA dehydrogenase